MLGYALVYPYHGKPPVKIVTSLLYLEVKSLAQRLRRRDVLLNNACYLALSKQDDALDAWLLRLANQAIDHVRRGRKIPVLQIKNFSIC